MSRDGGAADAIAQLCETDPGCLRRLRQQARRRHAGHGVDLEAPGLSLFVEPEVDAAVRTGFDGAMSRNSELADLSRGRLGKLGGEGFLGAASLVFAGVIEDVVKLRTNLADGKRFAVQDPDREFASRDESLDDHLIVVA